MIVLYCKLISHVFGSAIELHTNERDDEADRHVELYEDE